MRQSNINLTPRAFAQAKYNQARQTLLVVIIFTVVNLISIHADSYFLFSAYVPLLISAVGMGLEAEVAGAIAITTVIAVILTLPYILFYVFSKKHYGWMIAALVYFGIDTLILLISEVPYLSEDLGMLIDIVIHIAIMVYLIIAVKHGKTLNCLPEEAPITLEGLFSENESGNTENNTHPIRRTTPDEKSVKLCEATIDGHKITFRRCNKMNELVVDDYVYAEMKFNVFNSRYTLSATVYGVEIHAVYNNNSPAIVINGQVVAGTVYA